MRMLNLVALTLGIVFSVSWLSIMLSRPANDFMQANPFWNGLQDFQRQFDVEMVTNLDQAERRSGPTVLIAIPSLPYQDKELKKIKDFIMAGGTLLVMDDYGYGDQILQYLGLEIKFAGVPLLDPYLSYRNQRLPLATDLTGDLKKAGIQQLVLNHATALVISGPYKVLARSSDMAFLDSNGNQVWDGGETKGPLALAAMAVLEQGTVIAIADPSLLINSMINRGDNRVFLRYLVSLAGDSPRIILDTSHLPKTALDRSMDVWGMVQEQMTVPYYQVLLVGAILMLTLMPLWRKGDKFA